jgi:hypothetical protein
MLTKEQEEAIKKANLQETSLRGGKFEKYRFNQDSTANQMAFLFGGTKGEEAARKIINDATKKFPNILQISEREGYIKQEVEKRATDIDNEFHAGIKDIFETFNHKTSSKGMEAGSEAMFKLMTERLGLNVDKDNTQTHFDPGPPQIFQVTWVNRPSKELADPNSGVNALAQLYSNNLSEDKKKFFNNTWDKHKENAINGGPKIDKEQFLASADAAFEKTKQGLHKFGAHATPDSLRSEAPRKGYGS